MPQLSEMIAAYRKYQEAIRALTQLDPTRSYKNIVGDLGEFYACSTFQLKPVKGTGCDAINSEGKGVEIKTRTNATGKVEVKKDATADLLLVLLLDREGNFTCIYYGPIQIFFERSKFNGRGNHHEMTLAQLQSLEMTEG